MSSVHLKSSSISSNNSLVEQILVQGQRLRNSLVQAILNNDPFNKEIISNKDLTYPKFKTPGEVDKASSSIELPTTIPFLTEVQSETENKTTTICNPNKLFAFLQGDLMSHEDEKIALDTLRTISPSEFIKRSKDIIRKHCDCDVCYKDVKETNIPENSMMPPLSLDSLVQSKCDINEKPLSKCLGSAEHLKYVNNIKVIVHNLKLNTTGRRKLFNSCNEKKFATSSGKTFFIEYSIPVEFNKTTKLQNKVNTGLNFNKPIRFCSKKLFDQEAIYFKQMTIYEVSNICKCNLNEVNLKFRISCRTMNEKRALTFGEAIFNMETIMHNPLFTANQELSIIDIHSGLTLGSLKVSVSFGCDKIHFGEEFIDAIKANKGNASLSSNDSVLKILEEPTQTNVYIPIKSKHTKTFSSVGPNRSAVPFVRKPEPSTVVKSTKEGPKQMPTKTITDECLLYGLIFVSEANYLQNPIDSYVICHSFHNSDAVVGRVFHNNSNPILNFHQLEPILYNDEFLDRMRENYIVLEFWQKCENDQDLLIGISKLSLHQFYITYRNSAIVKHLLKNQHPVISVDWWEPIVKPFDGGEVCGQTQALLAIGTEAQIQQLELSRGLKQSSVIAKPSPIINDVEILKYSAKKQQAQTLRTGCEHSETVVSASRPKSPCKPNKLVKFAVPKTTKSVSKVDVATQSSNNMEPEKQQPNNAINGHRDLLMSLIEQLSATRNVQNRTVTENGTNTEPAQPNMEVSSETHTTDSKPKRTSASPQQTSCNNSNNNSSARRDTFTVPAKPATHKLDIKNTVDLLTSYQKACKLSSVERVAPEPEPNAFKCHVVVDEALHLPSRKKCKSRRTKGKHAKNAADDSIFPSAYVTFETVPGHDAHVTNVVVKSSSPKWDFRTDVMLPTDLLFNNQKRLIFKVWRKSNGPHLIPNHQTDLVLGFAALDLTVLMAGLPTIQGWFNIIDFSNKCNGQIKISVTPLENIQKLNKPKVATSFSSSDSDNALSNLLFSSQEANVAAETSGDSSDPFDASREDEPSELLSRALKRKFSELDEITQRLRLRLSKVTSADDSDVSNDDFSDAFERDINTLCVEDDFDTNNFEADFEPTQNILAADGLLQPQPSCSYAQDSSARDCLQAFLPSAAAADERGPPGATTEGGGGGGAASFGNHLTQGKLRIDTLLEKLSLITGNKEHNTAVQSSFNDRYVSGCSTTAKAAAADNDAHQRTLDSDSKRFVDGIMKELGIGSFEEDGGGCGAMNPSLLQQFYDSASSVSTPDLNSIKDLLTNSTCSVVSNEDMARSEPDGEGSVAVSGANSNNNAALP